MTSECGELIGPDKKTNYLAFFASCLKIIYEDCNAEQKAHISDAIHRAFPGYAGNGFDERFGEYILFSAYGEVGGSIDNYFKCVENQIKSCMDYLILLSKSDREEEIEPILYPMMFVRIELEGKPEKKRKKRKNSAYLSEIWFRLVALLRGASNMLDKNTTLIEDPILSKFQALFPSLPTEEFEELAKIVTDENGFTDDDKSTIVRIAELCLSKVGE